jgi:adenosylcobinamide-GDP ribazoletransferase
LNGFVVAARYLTVLPLPGAPDTAPEALGRSAAWFPAVGFLLGLLLVATDRLGSWLFPPILAALLTLTAWKLATGGLHLDGLADCLDGLSGRDSRDRLRIMRDSRIGTFGVVGLILVLLLGLSALAELPPAVRWRALLVAPTIGRGTAPLLGLIFPPVGDGHGAAFARSIRPLRAWVAALSALGISVLGLGLVGAVVWGAAFAVAIAVGWFLSRRLGGLTGDAFGAGIELSELAVLVLLASRSHLGLP